MQNAGYRATERSTPSRHSERAHYDRATVHAVLDEALICHLASVRDGRPVSIPTLHARVGERLYLHGSTGASISRSAIDSEVDVCVTATIVDGLVLARSAFNHSMNYRSVVVHGTAQTVTDEAERSRALAALVDHVFPARWDSCRRPTAKELAATSVLAVDLREVSAKCRTGDPVDDAEDLDGPWWAGVVPVQTLLGDPQPAADLQPGRVPPTAPEAAAS